MKTKTPIAPTETQQDAAAIFDAELASIQADRQRLTNQLAGYEREQGILEQREHERAQAEAAAQDAIDKARTVYQEAKLRAELLTAGELAKAAQKDLNKLEEQLRTAQDAQLKLFNKTRQEADSDARKRLHLQEARDRDQQTIGYLNERAQMAQSLKQKAVFEKAETALRSHLDTIAAMQAQRDQQQGILASMENEIAAYIHRASQDLASTPEQQKAFMAHFVYHDTLTGLLQAQIDLLDLVMATGRDAKEIPVEVARKAGVYWQNLPELLSLNAPDFWPVFKNSAVGPAILIERRDLLVKLLTIYRETHQ